MASLGLVVYNLIRLGHSVKGKSMPFIKAYACKQCSSIAVVSVEKNKIVVKKCRCA